MYDELVKRLREHGEFLIVSDRMKAPPNVNVRNVFAEDYYQAADAIEELTDTNVGKWIPVTERLPESVRKSYLCLTDTGYHCEARWTNNVFGCHYPSRQSEWGWSLADVPQYCKVTHWMPLPQPPKEE